MANAKSTAGNPESTELAVLENYIVDPSTIVQLAEAIKKELGDLGPLDLPMATVPSTCGTICRPGA